MSKGVVLLSGGIDSAVTAWIARQECEELSALTFGYGQRHEIKETRYAHRLGRLLGVVEHLELLVPIHIISKATLTGDGKDIPSVGVQGGIPTTWVPQRNSIFLAFAFGWAETLGYDSVWIGANVVDYSGYPDCRPGFILAIDTALNLASKRYVEKQEKIQLRAPVIQMSKSEEITLGRSLGVPFEKTWSCYRGGEKACGLCDSCRLRLKAFAEAGLKDPIEYEGV